MDLAGATGRFADDLLQLHHSRDSTKVPAELTAAYVTLANVKRTLDVTQRFWIQQSAARVQLFVDEADCRARFPKHLFRKSSEHRECEGRALEHFQTMHAAINKRVAKMEKRHAQASTFAELRVSDHDAVHDFLRVSKATLGGDRETFQLYLIRQNPNVLAIAMLDEGKLRSAPRQLDRQAVTALLTGLNKLLFKGNSTLLRTTSQLINILMKRITAVKALLYDGLRNVAAIRKALGNMDMDAGMRAVFGGLVEDRFSTLFRERGQQGGSIASVAGSILSILLAVPVAPLALLTIVMGVTGMALRVTASAGLAVYEGTAIDMLAIYRSDYRNLREKVSVLPELLGNFGGPSKMLIDAMFSAFDALIGTAHIVATAPQAAAGRAGAALAKGVFDTMGPALDDLQNRASATSERAGAAWARGAYESMGPALDDLQNRASDTSEKAGAAWTRGAYKSMGPALDDLQDRASDTSERAGAALAKGVFRSMGPALDDLQNRASDTSERAGAALAKGAMDAMWPMLDDLQKHARATMAPQEMARNLSRYVDDMSRVVMAPEAGEEAGKRLVDFFEGAMRGVVTRTGYHVVRRGKYLTRPIRRYVPDTQSIKSAAAYVGTSAKTLLSFANRAAINCSITHLVKSMNPFSSTPRRSGPSDYPPDEDPNVFHDVRELQDGGQQHRKSIRRSRRSSSSANLKVKNHANPGSCTNPHCTHR